MASSVVALAGLPGDIAQRWPPDPPHRKQWPLPKGLADSAQNSEPSI
jgi:hypothetical protein